MQRKGLITISNNKLNSNIFNKIIKAVINFKKAKKGIKYKKLINNNKPFHKYKRLINNNKPSYKYKRLINNNKYIKSEKVIKPSSNIIKYIYKKWGKVKLIIKTIQL